MELTYREMVKQAETIKRLLKASEAAFGPGNWDTADIVVGLLAHTSDNPEEVIARHIELSVESAKRKDFKNALTKVEE